MASTELASVREEPSEIQQLQTMAIEFAQRNQHLEVELEQLRKCEEEHLSEILRLRAVENEHLGQILQLRDDVSHMERINLVHASLPQSARTAPPAYANSSGGDGAAQEVSKLQAESASLMQAERASLLGERERLEAKVTAMQLDSSSMRQERDDLAARVSAAQQELSVTKEQCECRIRDLEVSKEACERQGKAAQEELTSVKEHYERRIQDLEVSKGACERHVQAAQEELQAAKEHYERRIQDLEASKLACERQVQTLEAEKAAANSSAEERLAHVTQLKQVVATHDSQSAKQLAELSASLQRCAELEESVSQMRSKEQELAQQLEQLRSSVTSRDPHKDAESRVCQLETMLDNMKTIESEYLAQVEALQLEKQELVNQTTELKQSGAQLDQQAKRILELEDALSQEKAARQTAETAVSLFEGLTGASGPDVTDMLDTATISQLNLTISELRAKLSITPGSAVKESQAGQGDRVQQLETEIAAHVKRNAELNQVIQSVQDRETRIANMEKALSMPGPPAAVGAPATQGRESSLLNPKGAARSGVPSVAQLFPAPTSEVHKHQTTVLPAPGTTPTSVDAVPARNPAPATAASASRPHGDVSPVRVVSMPWPEQAPIARERGISPVRMIAVKQLPGRPAGLERKAAVSPIRVVGVQNGPAREVSRREVSPMEFRARAYRVPGATPMESSGEARGPPGTSATTVASVVTQLR